MIRHICIRARRAQSDLPAAVIAEKLNVHRSTADRWVGLAGGDWARDAADRAQSAAT
ncbi:MAG: hypothetical protein M3450_13650 [Actinomycetota bacterium]|nr:hypothetical protein [Actinomycetota bacterium]